MLDIRIILGQNIKKLRKLHGLTQEEFAEKIDVSLKTISLVENGKFFTSYENLGKICDVFKITPSVLFNTDFRYLQNLSQTRTEAINNLNIILNNVDDDKLDAVIAFTQYLADKSISIKRHK